MSGEYAGGCQFTVPPAVGDTSDPSLTDILIEIVFSWPGIGRAVYQAVLQRDYPMLQGAFLVLTLSVIFFNLVADLLYFRLDPRITE